MQYSRSEGALLVMQLIELLEEFLDAKKITIQNPEKEQAVEDGVPQDAIANIYGTDFGQLQEGIEEILVNWEILEDEDGE